MTVQPGIGQRCIIVGAGIGGLTAGIALQQLGFDVVVYEAAPVLKPAGAGILLAPNALNVLEQLGCREKIQQKGHILTHGMKVTDRTRTSIQSIAGVNEKEQFGFQSSTIHRTALQQALLEELGTERVQVGKRCKNVQQDDEKVTLTCEDGSTDTADILLAADGIHSVVRKQLFSDKGLRYSGQTCWRGVAHFKAGKEWSGRGFEMWGRGIRLGILPISDEHVYWFSTLVTPAGGKDTDLQSAKDSLLDAFRDFADPALPVLKATPPESIIRHDLFDFEPISQWVQGRIALIGDAAHATTPNMGQGGCQAIEDAWGLQLAFREHASITDALLAFQELRLPKATMVVKNSYMGGKMAGLRNPLLCWIRNKMLRLIPASVVLKQLKNLYTIPKQL